MYNDSLVIPLWVGKISTSTSWGRGQKQAHRVWCISLVSVV